MNTNLKGKVVLVTGASGGIGAGIAKAFAQEGAAVVLHYRSGRANAEALRGELGAGDAMTVKADLRREPEVKKLFQRVLKQFGRIDTVVANAASWATTDMPMQDMSLRQWEDTLDSVLTSTFLTMREFLRVVARQKQGNAVLIASTAAVFGEAGHADYASAKAAIAYGLTRTLKNEMARLAPHTAEYCGGRVNCICPGWTVVPRLAAKLKQPETIRKATATMALPKLARPGDIGSAAVFLASDALAGHITGQTLVIAGGMEGRSLWQPSEIDTSIA